MDKEPAIFVGVDWAIVEHQVCMVGLDSRIQNAESCGLTSPARNPPPHILPTDQ